MSNNTDKLTEAELITALREARNNAVGAMVRPTFDWQRLRAAYIVTPPKAKGRGYSRPTPAMRLPSETGCATLRPV